MKKTLAILISSALLISFSSQAESDAQAQTAKKERAFTIKFGGSKLKTDVTGDKDFELYGRSLAFDYTSESNKWTDNKDLYLGYLASLDVHYNSKKKEDNHAIYQVEEVSSLIGSFAPKVSYMVTQQTALFAYAGVSYGALKEQDYKKTPGSVASEKEAVSGWGYLWGFGARYELDNNFEFGGEFRASHLSVDNDKRSGKADLYGLYATAGYRF
ncbi:outer membrane beta-barrel protein [Vibrio tapetis subsp. quintayensis]|uniref:outer membrane beta-barrel protein n=1 Tax=Vibrio tapetis TaxID=52443 RepID=UPI0025B43DEA|nr:outer membrane beta-barrel protein [Vibrio tapetis]MDN3680760.1 outer membrane beta-barrel protein [Vibrio tapetis subsp. quintayensis]